MIHHWPVAAALRFFRCGTAAAHKQTRETIARIRRDGQALSSLRDGELALRIDDLRRRAQAADSVAQDEILIPAFALVNEAARRVLSIDLYDVQLLGGLALARGAIAEMQTGEGKTFAALLPAALHALTGQGVHVMTVNAYLAKRDFELLAPVYQLLGLTVGLIEAETEPVLKREAYAKEITYGPGYEFGFDYLRDQMAIFARRNPTLGEGFRGRLQGQVPSEPVPLQRGHAAAVVDEADSVMIDEALTPLILALGGNQPASNAKVYLAALQTARQLKVEQHFVLNQTANVLTLTPQGLSTVARHASDVQRCGLERPWQVYVEQALRSDHLYRPDVHYVIRDDEIQIVDQYTGRIFADRSWREGLQQAMQAKEGLPITSEPKSIARITRQRYFRRYTHLCGMTGTAQGSDRELRDVYGVDVLVIPPHRPCKRQTFPLLAFADRTSKEKAILSEIMRIHRTRQPVLVGTADIETSERLARLLDEQQIPYQLLNGKQDAEEAGVVAGAGELGAVTIATNMAGRGTDIKLGHGAADVGGLHVIVTEPQESARVDRQLVGRAARQGDPGSCRLFTSATDPLFTRHAPSVARRLQQTAEHTGEIPQADGLTSVIARLQGRIERAKAQQRQQLYAHDDWLERVLRDLV